LIKKEPLQAEVLSFRAKDAKIRLLALAQRRVARTFREKERVEFGRVLILFWEILLRQDRIYRAFRHTGTTVDAGVWVDVEPGPFVFRLARNNTFYRTNLGTGAIANAQVKNHMGHDKTS
jgi:hypothetical protein